MTRLLDEEERRRSNPRDEFSLCERKRASRRRTNRDEAAIRVDGADRLRRLSSPPTIASERCVSSVSRRVRESRAAATAAVDPGRRCATRVHLLRRRLLCKLGEVGECDRNAYSTRAAERVCSEEKRDRATRDASIAEKGRKGKEGEREREKRGNFSRAAYRRSGRREIETEQRLPQSSARGYCAFDRERSRLCGGSGTRATSHAHMHT